MEDLKILTLQDICELMSVKIVTAQKIKNKVISTLNLKRRFITGADLKKYLYE